LKKKCAEAVLCPPEGKNVGFALIFHNFSTFLGRGGIYLEDLFVLHRMAGQGYGRPS
jgi:GNAT superfamily N-acetyltransferase